MPYTSKRNRAKYQKKYREHRRRQRKAIEKALKNGDLAKARRVLKQKPKIHVKTHKKRRRKK